MDDNAARLLGELILDLQLAGLGPAAELVVATKRRSAGHLHRGFSHQANGVRQLDGGLIAHCCVCKFLNALSHGRKALNPHGLEDAVGDRT